jgi:CDGSH-type Zn-finger protein
MSEEKKPTIEATKDGPYIVSNLQFFKNSRCEPIEIKPVMALCRCGKSGTKPFCDGTHAKIGFKGEKLEGRQPDRVDDYKGEKITIHDNRGVCSHAGHCTDNLPKVWMMNKEPWINPDGEEPEKIEEVIKMCPSGALSYTKGGALHKDWDRHPEIRISRDGPYRVVGSPSFKDHEGSKPESKEHYTLCRCGGSKNKPFCDGTHWYIKFKDPKN